MRREFVIVYKAKHPEFNVRDMYLSGGWSSPAHAYTADLANALIFYTDNFFDSIISSGHEEIDEQHEPGVVMEKVTTISLKTVD